MKKSILVLAILVALLAVASTALAGQFSYTAGIQVQNLEGAQASVSLAYYNQDGSLAIDPPPTDTIPANGSKTYFPIHAGTGFNGSVVISSDKQIAAITNIGGDGFSAAASYVGASAGGTSVNLPLLMKNNSGYSTWFNVQNTGTSDAVVTVNYSDGTSDGATIKPGAAATFDQLTDGLAHPAVFSAVVTSGVPVAVTVIEESSSIMFAYSGFVSGSPNPVMPLINANNGDYRTGVQIQNTGGTATTVEVTYTPSYAGMACTETQTIPANSSATFALFAFNSGANSDCDAGATFVGSAQVTGNTAGNDLAVIVNQFATSNGEAYGGFDPAAATETVVAPLIMDRNSGYWTGLQIMNVGGGSTTVTCTFTNTSYSVTATLAAGEAMTDLQNNKIADGYVGSATCSAPGGSIVGVVNELGPSASKDQLLVYEGVNN